MCTLEAILHSCSIQLAYLSFLSTEFSLYNLDPMKSPFKTSVSILIDNPWVSMDYNTSSPLKQPSASSSDHLICPSCSHLALSKPFKTRNLALGSKTDNVTHRHLLKQTVSSSSQQESGHPCGVLLKCAVC